MTRQEFVDWLEKYNYRVVEQGENYTRYTRGYRTIDVYLDGTVEVNFVSSVEITSYITNTNCFEDMGDLGLRVIIWVYNGDGNEVEEEHYLYR